MIHVAIEAPVIETDRLILRAPAERDAEGYVAFWASERSRHLGGPKDRPRAWEAFAMEFGHWHLRGFGSWAVTLKGDDTCLGFIGGWYPDGWPDREIDWMLWDGAEGRGIAFEAIRAVREHAYRTLGWSGAVSYIEPGNDRSIRLAGRLGCTRVDEPTPYPGGLVYRHPAPEALQ